MATPTPDRIAPNLWLQIAAAAVVLGLLTNILFNGASLGLNVPLWIGALIATFLFAARRTDTPIGKLSISLLAASFGLSMMIVWRSAATLQLLLLTASISLLLLALVTHDESRARRASITLFFASLAFAARSTLRGTVLLPRSLPWRESLDRDSRQRAQAIGRATLITAPLILIFGALFFAADAVFETWVRNSLTTDLTALLGHLAWLLGGTAVATGLLWCGLAPEETPPTGPRLADERRLRPTEIGVVLGSLSALFALFVAIQVQYLFSGDSHVQASTGLTYAEYARRGFFELVAVAALLLPVLLAADWARTRNPRSLTVFRILTGLLVLLLIVVVASAFQRMRVYMDAYGLTALRLYVSVTLAWLAAVFLWLLWSLLRERRNEFIAGAVLTALIALVALVALNPHATIAATNLARAEQRHDFDTPYAVGLSADATPTLVTGIDVLPPDDACQLATTLLDRWDTPALELRSWNWARTSARAAVDSNRDRLQSACG